MNHSPTMVVGVPYKIGRIGRIRRIRRIGRPAPARVAWRAVAACEFESTERRTTEGSSANLPQRWGLWLAVQGDLRFLSHRDCARLIERAAVRAQLPLKYTQGFNPHPVLSLVPPRPVGVASRDDLLVIWLTQPLDDQGILSAMNRQAPRGMEFLHARRLEPGQSPVPRGIRCQWPIPPDRLETLRRQADLFAAASSWPIERSTPADSRDRAPRKRPLDLKALVQDLAVRDGVLCWSQTPAGDLWARPGEVLGALGQDSHVDLAAVVRTAVDYGL